MPLQLREQRHPGQGRVRVRRGERRQRRLPLPAARAVRVMSGFLLTLACAIAVTLAVIFGAHIYTWEFLLWVWTTAAWAFSATASQRRQGRRP